MRDEERRLVRVRESRFRLQSAIREMAVPLAPGLMDRVNWVVEQRGGGPLPSEDLRLFAEVFRLTGEFHGEITPKGKVQPARGLMRALERAETRCVPLYCSVEGVEILLGVESAVSVRKVRNVKQLFGDWEPACLDAGGTTDGTSTSLVEDDLKAILLRQAAEFETKIYRVVDETRTEIGISEFLKQLGEAAVQRQRVLFVGRPGVGKTMIARRLPALLGEMMTIERRRVARNFSDAGLYGRVGRPFRAPHHSVSERGMIGSLGIGGDVPRPGELTLAECGVLYLDEVNEFSSLVRGNLSGSGPFRPWIVMSANPCACGWRGSAGGSADGSAGGRDCRCSNADVAAHWKRIPKATEAELLRFDLV